MAASTNLQKALHSALCGKVRKDEMTAILDAATHTTISQDLKNMARSVWGESAGEEVIAALTAGSVTPSPELILRSASELGRDHPEFLTLLAAVA